jgi:hypothetical protein
MSRTLCYRAVDDNTVLREEHTDLFHLSAKCERGAGELGALAGSRTRVELRNDGGHLLDYWTYHLG